MLRVCQRQRRHLWETLKRVPPSPPLDNIRVMVIVWRLRGKIIRTALCWIVWHNVHSPQHTYMSSSCRSNRLDLSHWDPYAVCRGGCLELYYCNMVEWFWWDLNLILTTNWFPSVLWHCWFGHLACKNRPEMTYYMSSGTLNPTHSLKRVIVSPAVYPRFLEIAELARSLCHSWATCL